MSSSPRSTDAGGTGLDASCASWCTPMREIMATDFGASLVRFDPRDLTDKNSRIVRAAKKSIDGTFRSYISAGIADGSIKACDVKLSAFAIAGSLNWIGHWYQRNGKLSAETVATAIFHSPDRGSREGADEKKSARSAQENQTIVWREAMNITHGLRRALQINPNGHAVTCGARRRNWREVGDRVSRLAAGLRGLGVDTGDRVAILSLNSDRYLELYLATGWAGAVIVPLNIRWSPLENEDALRDCRANVLVVDKAFSATAAVLAQSHSRPGAGLRRRRRGARRHAAFRGPDRGKRADARCRLQERGPRRHLLHRRHDRPVEGRHAQPRQPDDQRAERAG